MLVFTPADTPSISLSFSSGLEDDGPQPPHERSDASQSDPPGPSVPPAVPVGPRARSRLHHVGGRPGKHLSGHRELQENRQAPGGSQGIWTPLLQNCCYASVFEASVVWMPTTVWTSGQNEWTEQLFFSSVGLEKVTRQRGHAGSHVSCSEQSVPGVSMVTWRLCATALPSSSALLKGQLSHKG